MLAAVVAAIPPLVLLAATHLTVVPTRKADDQPLNSARRSAGARRRREHRAPGKPRQRRADRERRDADAAGAFPPEPAAAAEIEAPPAAPETTPPDASEGAGSGRRVRAEELRAAGWSNKRIAREVGVHPSTVGRWFSTRPAGSRRPVTRAPATRKNTTMRRSRIMNPHEHDHRHSPTPRRGRPRRPRPRERRRRSRPPTSPATEVTRPGAGVAGRRARGSIGASERPAGSRDRRMSRAAIDFNAHLSEQSRTGLGHGATWAGAQAPSCPPPRSATAATGRLTGRRSGCSRGR